ncbi:MAG: hypothetical protein V3W41_12095 [Planctomycetota bacterium]
MKLSFASTLAAAVAALLCLGLGFFVGSEWGDSQDPDEVGAPRQTADGDIAENRSPNPRSEAKSRRRLAAIVPEETQDAADVLFSEKLMGYFRTEYRGAWETERENEISTAQWEKAVNEFKTAVLALPATMALKSALDANRDERLAKGLENAEQDSVLEAIQKGLWAPDATTFDAELMGRILKPQLVGGNQGGPSFQSDKRSKPRNGLTLFFPRGIHKLSPRKLQIRRNVVEDLTIAGAGKDQTLLQLGELDSRESIKRLSFKDLTIDLGDDYFFDVRGNSNLSIDMLRTRLVRFDMGAGGSLAFAVGGGAIIRAIDCEFLGGYGRSPGSGNLYRGRPGWMYFSRCRFSMLDLNIRQGSAIRFDDCNFDGMRSDPRKRHPKLFRGGSFTKLQNPREYRRRKPISLATLFPDFK